MKFVVILSFITATCALAQPAPKAPNNTVDPKVDQHAPDAPNERRDRPAEKRPAEKRAADKRAADHRATQPAAARRRVVFLVDATGSMLEQFDKLSRHVVAAAAELGPDDQFGIVCDHDEKARLLSTTLLPRDAPSLKRAAEFMEKTSAHGSGDPVAAFKAALALRPTLIWYATDADFHDPNLKPVAAAVRAANTNRVRINTVLHFAAENAAAPHFLWQIAHDSGGVCLDASGKPVTQEPPDPDKPAPRPTSIPAPTPSIFHEP